MRVPAPLPARPRIETFVSRAAPASDRARAKSGVVVFQTESLVAASGVTLGAVCADSVALSDSIITPRAARENSGEPKGRGNTRRGERMPPQAQSRRRSAHDPA